MFFSAIEGNEEWTINSSIDTHDYRDSEVVAAQEGPDVPDANVHAAFVWVKELQEKLEKEHGH